MTKRERALNGLKKIDPIKVEDAVSSLNECSKAIAACSTKTGFSDRTVVVTAQVNRAGKGNEATVRGTVTLPHGVGKQKRVLVFCKPDRVDAVIAAGATQAGGAELASKVKEGFDGFDVVLATPDMMGVVGPLGRVLGPKGLMPSPKAGTVTDDVETTVKEFVRGRVEFRADDGGNLNVPVGVLSFSPEALVDNVKAACSAICATRPLAVRGRYVRSLWLTATMLPAFRLEEELGI